MKFLSFARVIVFTVFLTASAALIAQAQTNSNNTSNYNTVTTPARTVERTTVREEKGTDWGWLGLLGLAGLAGLVPKKRAVEVHDNRTVRDDTTTNRTTDTTTNM